MENIVWVNSITFKCGKINIDNILEISRELKFKTVVIK